MWISRGIWRSLLLWNKLQVIKGEVVVRKTSLSLTDRKNEKQERNNLLYNLHKQHYSNVEISTILKSNFIKIFTG